MAATRKIDFILGAYSELRINGLTTNPDSQELEFALTVLEDMASQYFAGNIIPDYNFTETPNLSDLTWVGAEFNRFFKTNLAVWLCNAFGKDVPPNLSMNASGALSYAAGVTARALLAPVQYPDRMPVGSGISNRYRMWQRFQRPGQPPPADSSTHQMYIGDINDDFETWDSYLRDGETISNINSVWASPGLLLSTVALSSTRVTFTVQALSQQTAGNFQQVRIIVQTSLGRISTRLVNFNIMQSIITGDQVPIPPTPPPPTIYYPLTAGAHMSGGSFDFSVDATFDIDADYLPVSDSLVERDSGGNSDFVNVFAPSQASVASGQTISLTSHSNRIHVSVQP